MTIILSRIAGLWHRCAIAIALIVVVPAVAEAMRVSPMVVEMGTSGTNAVARVEVQNLNRGNLPFETRITRLTYDQNGNATETPADSDFLVFPPQGVLPQGARQVIRLQWVGGTEIPASQAYYLSVNQLPVTLGPGEHGQTAGEVQIVYHMKALVVVSPANAQPDVRATAVRQIEYQPPAPSADAPLPPKVSGIEVSLRNEGRRHAMMAGLRWIVEGTGRDGRRLRLAIPPEDLNRLIGTGYIAPLGGTRTFQIPLSEAFGPGPITVRFAQ